MRNSTLLSLAFSLVLMLATTGTSEAFGLGGVNVGGVGGVTIGGGSGIGGGGGAGGGMGAGGASVGSGAGGASSPGTSSVGAAGGSEGITAVGIPTFSLRSLPTLGNGHAKVPSAPPTVVFHNGTGRASESNVSPAPAVSPSMTASAAPAGPTMVAPPHPRADDTGRPHSRVRVSKKTRRHPHTSVATSREKLPTMSILQDPNP
jgi:hypothetical protein